MIGDWAFKFAAFILAFGILVTIHEMGHYLVARWCGVKILRFSVGMGKVLWMRRFGKDQTEWAISAIPLGGYVKMLDAREADMQKISSADLDREFTRQNVWKRFAIVAAGPLANFLLAIAIFTGLNMFGTNEPITQLRAMAEDTPAYQAGLRAGQIITAVDGEPVQVWSQLRKKLLIAGLEKRVVQLDTESAAPNSTDSSVRILGNVRLSLENLSQEDLEGDYMARLGLAVKRGPAKLGKVMDDGPAARAGLRRGDIVLQVDGKAVIDALALIEIVQASPDRELRLNVLREGQEMEIFATPKAEKVQDRLIGRLHMEIPAMPIMREVSYDFFPAIGKAIAESWETSYMTVKMLGKMLTGQVSLKNLTGPITIADYAGKTANIGWFSYLSFIAFISLSLGVMNLLPIPMLDGGHLLYYSLEILTGRPLPARIIDIAGQAGVGILMMMMAIALFNDVASRIP